MRTQLTSSVHRVLIFGVLANLACKNFHKIFQQNWQKMFWFVPMEKLMITVNYVNIVLFAFVCFYLSFYCLVINVMNLFFKK